MLSQNILVSFGTYWFRPFKQVSCHKQNARATIAVLAFLAQKKDFLPGIFTVLHFLSTARSLSVAIFFTKAPKIHNNRSGIVENGIQIKDVLKDSKLYLPDKDHVLT